MVLLAGLPGDGPGERITSASYSTECYIEAKSDVAFGIRLEVEETVVKPGPIGHYDLLLATNVDGDCLDRKVIKNSDLGMYDLFSANRPSGRHLIQQDYHFSPLSIVDDSGQEPDAELATRLAKTGTISVSLYRCTVGEPMEIPNIDQAPQKTGLQEPISEEALKGRAISHLVKLGAPRFVAYNLVSTVFLDPDGRPLATVAFRYRSRAALQAIGLIPREPATIPLEDRLLESVNADEMRELLRRERVKNDEIQALKRKIKEERNANVTEAGRSDGHRSKRPRNGTGEIEIVDLT